MSVGQTAAEGAAMEDGLEGAALLAVWGYPATTFPAGDMCLLPSSALYILLALLSCCFNLG